MLLRSAPLAALLVALAIPHGDGGAQPDGDAHGFAVYHYASEVEGTAFREVFLVHRVGDALDAATADVQVLRDGEPLAVAWQDADGRLTAGDRFSFVQEAFDQKQVLTASVGGRDAMSCRFGGGAGIPFTPGEWAAMGLADQVRCLELTDDQ